MTFSANNGPYTVKVAPITSVGNGTTLEGAQASLPGIRPFGPPAPPSGGGPSPGYRSVNFSGWSAPAPNGRPIKGVEFQRPGGGWQSGGSTTVDTAQGGDRACINLRTAAEGETSRSDALQHRETTLRRRRAAHRHRVVQPRGETIKLQYR